MDESLSAPEKAGRYTLLVPIGAGGMATVYLGRASVAGDVYRDVAIKVLKTNWDASPQAGQDLVEEAKLAASIKHPNVVAAVEVVREAGQICLVMDYVEGDTLAGLIGAAKRARSRLPTPIAMRILSDALRGLHAAHELTDAQGHNQGLVHRDFSPQNVLVGIDGISRLSDFGIAKAVSRLGATTQNVLKGKVGYMSPEQVRGERLTRTSDVWAAGVVAWEALAGRRLFRGKDDVATLLHVASDAPIPVLADAAPHVPKALSEVIHRALQRESNRRFASAAEFEQALAAACRKHDGLAEWDEVGAYVRGAAQVKLTERREAAKRVAELRSSLRSVAAQALERADEQTATTPSSLDPRPIEQARRPRATLSRLAVVASFAVAGVAVFMATRSGTTPRVAEPRAERGNAPGRRATLQLALRANVPISAVSVDGASPVDIKPPARVVLVPVANFDQPREVKVSSVDGRQRVLRLGAQTTSMVVEFERRAVGAARPAKARTTKPSPVPFASTPYKTK
ncbi:MAG: serine/threonine-protein kinase [Polyangiaceae bacterium]